MKRLRVFTWHVHGSYLYYLSHLPCEILLPVSEERGNGYYGRTPSYPWPENVTEVPIESIKSMQFDCILFQSPANYLEDQYKILSAEQRHLPKVYLEHDPPGQHPSDTKHCVDNPAVLVVHVTHFNRLMWNNRRSPVVTVAHGVTDHGWLYNGSLKKAIAVVNNIRRCGRRLGYDLLMSMRAEVPIDLVGTGWDEADGVCEVAHHELPQFISNYRFFFNPIRYTSLGLAVCEAMMAGMPIVGFATTELSTIVKNGYSGYIDTNPEAVLEVMKDLLNSPQKARKWSKGARQTALQHFNLTRFEEEWLQVFAEVTGYQQENLKLSAGG